MLGLGSGRPVLIADGVTEGINLPDGVVIDAAFGDEVHGIAMLEPGLTLATEDGGQHWRTVNVERAAEVVAVGATRWTRGRRECLDPVAMRPPTDRPRWASRTSAHA
jgi:hypothetical protein